MSAADADRTPSLTAVDHLLVSTGEGFALVQDLTGGRLVRVSPSSAALLGLLSGFKPAEEQLASLSGDAVRLLDRGFLSAALAELEEAALVCDESRLLADLASSRRSRLESPALRIEAASWLTRSRYDSLERSMSSFIRNFAAAGRVPLLRVFDDSPDPRERESCRSRLAALSRSSGLRIDYAGYEEKAALAERLSEAGGVERDVVDFALFGLPDLGAQTIGANHNAALLFSRSLPYLHCDDDILCEIAPSPEREEGFVLSERDHLGCFRFYDSEAELAREISTEPADVLGRFEELLGRDAGELILEEWPGSRCRLESVSPAFVRRLALSALRPAIVSVGCYGDSGMRNPSILEAMPTARLLSLFLDEDSYDSALRSRTLWRHATSRGMTRNPSFMSMNAALAPALGLPPHFPCFHNEDGLFAASYLKLNPGGAIGHLPFGLRHASANQPFYEEGDRIYRPGLDDVIVALIEELRPPPAWPALSGEARFAELAAHIGEVLGREKGRAVEYVSDKILHAYASRMEALERRAEDDSLPGYLRRGMLTASARRRRLIEGGRFVPGELADRSDWGDIVVSLGRSYARLLEAWPALTKTAASLE